MKFQNEDFPGIEIDETGEYFRISDRQAFLQFIKDGDWNSEEDFYEATGCTIDELLNEWFVIIHNRIYLKKDN